ncbi:MAG: Rrf2 family transcriptional regulator [Actinobacteria bacterium]|nr:MAG: Rrf2 family transcriptional regulator [Actinomycetota bacterium]
MQLEFTRKSELALRALGIISRTSEGFVNGPEIANALSISPHYLTTVMAPLSRAGWVRSATGPTGGYRLSTDISNYSVLDLVESIEGAIDKESCMHGDLMRPIQEPCALHEPWTRAREALLKELETANLAEVLGLQP